MPLPLDLLEKSLNAHVLLSLKDGRSVEGLLVGYDQYMNLVVEEAVERATDGERRLGTIVLRGNNLIAIAAPKAGEKFTGSEPLR
jgi:small nuclear ribonucleoprotein